MVPEIGHIVKICIKITIEEGEIIVTEVAIENIGPITEIVVDPEKGTVMEMATGITIDRSNYRRDDSNQRYGIRSQDHGSIKGQRQEK